MEKDYLKLTNGRLVRIESNMNSLETYMKEKGAVDLKHLDDLANIQFADVKTLLHACAQEGERMEGNELELSALDLAAMLRPNGYSLFMKIFADQSRNNLQTEKPTTAKKKGRFPMFRRR